MEVSGLESRWGVRAVWSIDAVHVHCSLQKRISCGGTGLISQVVRIRIVLLFIFSPGRASHESRHLDFL